MKPIVKSFGFQVFYSLPTYCLRSNTQYYGVKVENIHPINMRKLTFYN